MKKEIVGKDVVKRLKDGVDIIADTVKVTLGARGRNVIIRKEVRIPDESSPLGYRSVFIPQITKDGVTVAKSIELDDQMEDMGGKITIEASARTCEDAGDGTTTTCVLTQALLSNGLKYIEEGGNPIYLNKGIDIAVSAVVKYIEENSKKVNNDVNVINQIATISANNNDEIGHIIADAFKKVGKDGVVAIDKGKKESTETIIEKGYWFDNGYDSAHFINDQKKNKCVLEDAYVLISDKEISSNSDIMNILSSMIETSADGKTLIKDNRKPILFICDKLEAEPLSFLIANKDKNAIECCVVKAPGFGPARKDWLEDIAIITGGRFISSDKNDLWNDVKLSDLGRVKRLEVGNKDTKLIGGTGNKNETTKRAKLIRSILKDTTNDFKVKQLEERLAKFNGGMAIITVGGVSETEMKERYDRVEDAVCAVIAAKEKGFVAGAGSMFIQARNEILSIESEDEDIKNGLDVVYESLLAPTKTILSNAGTKKDFKIEELKPSMGVNVITDEVENLYESGIIDPAKVLISSLKNASAAAQMILTTAKGIIDKL